MCDVTLCRQVRGSDITKDRCAFVCSTSRRGTHDTTSTALWGSHFYLLAYLKRGVCRKRVFRVVLETWLEISFAGCIPISRTFLGMCIGFVRSIRLFCPKCLLTGRNLSRLGRSH